MTLNQNILRTRHRILPNPRTVTLTPQQPAAAAVTVPNARKRPVSRDFLAFNPVGNQDAKAEFLLPFENCGGTVPNADDKITDNDSVDWLIINVKIELEEAVYRCVVTNWKGTT